MHNCIGLLSYILLRSKQQKDIPKISLECTYDNLIEYFGNGGELSLLERWLQHGVGASLNTLSIHNKEIEKVLGVE